MSSLSMVEASLPPGFRFHPRDDELVIDYLSKKLGGGGAASVHRCPTLVDVDLNKCEPWDLPEIACIGGKEWYFYSLKDRKYATGQRTNRATESGYWKATGKDREITRKGLLVGMRKTLVFYRGRAPKGKKTDWVMHEFRKEEQGHHHQMELPLKEDWVLCRAFYKSRATVAVPAMQSASYINGTSPSPLPPIVDNSISFSLSGVARNLEGYEEVPCFSSSPQPPPSTNMPSIPDVDYLFEGQHAVKAIKDVLNQFTRFERLAVKRDLPLQGLNQDGFESHHHLTENGSSQTWNSFMS